MNKNIFFLLFLLLSAVGGLNLSCSTTDPKLEPDLKLELKDVSCTEAWLQLTTNNIQLPATINLLKNNSVTRTFSLSTQDSLLYIDSLLPNQTYKILAAMQQSNNAGNELTVTTMDTTSHNFTWQTFTFGEHSSSTLYNVAIIDENNIWAVGEIYMNDSLGNPDPICYNAVHWDGQNWELIKMGGYGGYPRRTVFAFSANDVWFDGVIKWDGANYTVHKNGWPLMPNGDNWQVNKMWGNSSNDLYAVGNSGNIAHYQNGSWTKIESGTTLTLQDISSANKSIFISGYSNSLPESIILRLNEGSIKSFWQNQTYSGTLPYGINVFSLVCFGNDLFVVSDDGVFKTKINFNAQTKHIYNPYWFVYQIFGTDVNNVFTVGDQSQIMHFNGLNSKQIYSDPGSISSMYSGTAKDNLVVGVGTKVIDVVHHKATIIIGRRN